mmetsp:Transcript_26458/g.76908  ORF Transcript_26458/g.76908 Transcript_26458/m.76908 type:complete len:470 (+) Transcript_26458:2882-4291(+)
MKDEAARASSERRAEALPSSGLSDSRAVPRAKVERRRELSESGETSHAGRWRRGEPSGPRVCSLWCSTSDSLAKRCDRLRRTRRSRDGCSAELGERSPRWRRRKRSSRLPKGVAAALELVERGVVRGVESASDSGVGGESSSPLGTCSCGGSCGGDVSPWRTSKQKETEEVGAPPDAPPPGSPPRATWATPGAAGPAAPPHCPPPSPHSPAPRAGLPGSDADGESVAEREASPPSQPSLPSLPRLDAAETCAGRRLRPLPGDFGFAMVGSKGGPLPGERAGLPGSKRRKRELAARPSESVVERTLVATCVSDCRSASENWYSESLPGSDRADSSTRSSSWSSPPPRYASCAAGSPCSCTICQWTKRRKRRIVSSSSSSSIVSSSSRCGSESGGSCGKLYLPRRCRCKYLCRMASTRHRAFHEWPDSSVHTSSASRDAKMQRSAYLHHSRGAARTGTSGRPLRRARCRRT